MTPQETDPDLPLSVGEAPAEAWVSGGLLQGWGHWVQQCRHGTFCRRSPLSSLPPPQFAVAKSLQLCLTLCDPIDSSPPGSLAPGILQARTLEWVAIAFSATIV